MENYIVSARKYRPQAFAEVVGQSHVTNTLFKAIENNHLAQALLFTGPRGVGKTTSARILARMINMDENHGEDQDFSFNIFELDAASNNSVDDIRNLIDQVRFAPQVGSYKVYIIDEVHMLSQAAFNAFLKTLEEPPKHAIFILATTEKHKIIPTILSRCQIYDFKRISVDDIAGHLKNVAAKEGVTAEDTALRIIAQKADGALRDALSIFDRIVSFSGDHISYQDVIENLRILDYDYYFRTIDYILEANQAGLLNLFDEILENGFDGHLYLNGLASHARDLLVCQDPSTLSLLEVGAEVRDRYQAQAKLVNSRFILQGLKILSEADVRYKNSNNSRLLVELALMELLMVWQKINKTPAGSEKKNSSPNLAEQKSTEDQGEVQKQPPSSIPAAPAADSIKPPVSVITEDSVQKQEPIVPSVKVDESPTKSEPKEETAKTKLKKKRSSNSFSISQTLKGEGPNLNTEEEQEEEDLDRPVDGKPQKPFNLEELKATWTTFVDKARAEGQKVVVAMLDNKDLRIKENFEIEVSLDNNLQAQKFQEIKRDLLYHCRENLQNFALFFSIKIEQDTKKLDPYSAPEKYQYLLEKNPHLAKMREDLGLDIE